MFAERTNFFLELLQAFLNGLETAIDVHLLISTLWDCSTDQLQFVSKFSHIGNNGVNLLYLRPEEELKLVQQFLLPFLQHTFYDSEFVVNLCG
jgi:hypothetical protein